MIEHRIALKPGRQKNQAEVNCSDIQLRLIEYSVGLLKMSGFKLWYTSLKSEACYYKLGDRVGLLRVAAHRFSPAESRLLTSPVWSCLTFPQNGPRSVDALHTHIASAVGRYILAPHTKTGSHGNKVSSLCDDSYKIIEIVTDAVSSPELLGRHAD